MSNWEDIDLVTAQQEIKVLEALASGPQRVKNLMLTLSMPEHQIREALLRQEGICVQRGKRGLWCLLDKPLDKEPVLRRRSNGLESFEKYLLDRQINFLRVGKSRKQQCPFYDTQVKVHTLKVGDDFVDCHRGLAKTYIYKVHGIEYVGMFRRVENCYRIDIKYRNLYYHGEDFMTKRVYVEGFCA